MALQFWIGSVCIVERTDCYTYTIDSLQHMYNEFGFGNTMLSSNNNQID